jgi:hypothetical protein
MNGFPCQVKDQPLNRCEPVEKLLTKAPSTSLEMVKFSPFVKSREWLNGSLHMGENY